MRGVTLFNSRTSQLYAKFQLTRLMRGVTSRRGFFTPHSAFQLTRLMRGVTTRLSLRVCLIPISTHTPHARRDDRCEKWRLFRQ